MNNLTVILKLVKKDLLNPKFYHRFLFCFLIVLIHLIIANERYIIYAQELGLGINVLEPVLVLLTSVDSPVLMGALLVLTSDAPFRDKGDYYSAYRVGRVRWLSAKILVMISFIVLFVVTILLASIITCLPVLEFSRDFSEFTQLPKIPGVNYFRILPISEQVFKNYSLVEAVLYASGIFILWGMIVGLVVLNANLRYHRFYGIVLAGLLLPLGRMRSEHAFGFRGLFYHFNLMTASKSFLSIAIAIMAMVIFALIVFALVQVDNHSMHEKE